MAVGTTKPKPYPVRELSLGAIKVDRALQSRVAVSPEYQREFSEAMLRGDAFPPVTVFIDETGALWLSDGFYRVGAAAKAGFRSIRAEVRPGSRRDAMVFSAGANKAFLVPMTRADKRKAVLMLMGDPGWFASSSRAIAKYVGVSHTYVQIIRDDYCRERSLRPPKEITTTSGKTWPVVTENRRATGPAANTERARRCARWLAEWSKGTGSGHSEVTDSGADGAVNYGVFVVHGAKLVERVRRALNQAG